MTGIGNNIPAIAAIMTSMPLGIHVKKDIGKTPTIHTITNGTVTTVIMEGATVMGTTGAAIRATTSSKDTRSKGTIRVVGKIKDNTNNRVVDKTRDNTSNRVADRNKGTTSSKVAKIRVTDRKKGETRDTANKSTMKATVIRADMAKDMATADKTLGV
jgi:hypothetical protein